MSSLKRHLPLILMAMLLLLIIPMSFAADADNNTADVAGIASYDADALSVDDNVVVEGSSDDDALSASYDYETIVTPSSINYTSGASYQITIQTKCDDAYQETLDKYDFYAYFDGENSNPVKINIPIGWSYKYMKFDLSQISEYLHEGENTIYFHHSLDENLFLGGWVSNTHFNPLTVNIKALPSYVSTPSPLNIYFYTVGDSRQVNVNISYSDLFKERLSEETKMFAYINGEETANRVEIEGVAGNATSFTFDLACVSDKLVEGVNNLTFHPDADVMEGIQAGPYVFNTLKVSAQKPAEPTYKYVTTPSVSEIEHAKGESTIVNVTADYLSDEDDQLSGYDLAGSTIYVYINGSSRGVPLASVFSDSKFFSVDLKDFDDKFEVDKSYSLIFRPPNGILSGEEIELSDCKFNPLTVNVKGPSITTKYEINITDPASASIEYVKGNESVKIFVKTNYNYTTMKALDNSKMYAYVNGNPVGIVNSTFDTEVRGSATTFAFYLSQFDDYLSEGINTIVLHPDESYYGQANITSYSYQTLTVKVVGNYSSEIKYESTPTVDGNDSIEYIINDHKDVLITVDCELLDQFESYDKLFAWVGESPYQINRMANEGTVTVDLYSFISENYFEEGKTYTIYFHPEIADLNAIGINDDECRFNPLTVKIIDTYTPEPTLVYTSTPKADGKTNVDYVVGENLTVTVTITYNESSKENEGFEGKSMRIFINTDTSGILISDVKANATYFTVNLADYITEEGEYDINFNPGNSVLTWVFNGIDNPVFEIRNLTVNAVKAPEPGKPSYNVTADTPVDYTRNTSQNITVTISFDDVYADADLPMYVFFGEAAQGILVEGARANDTSFEFDLGAISDKLSNGKNTISFHPVLEDLAAIAEGNFRFTKVTVNVNEGEHEPTYITTPNPNSTVYTDGESKNITVNVIYDEFFRERLDFTMFVYINGEDMENRVEIEGVRANDTSFDFDLSSISDKLIIGENILTFHPHVGALEGVFVGPYEFDPLTVNVEGAPIETNVSYVTTPVPSAVNYALNESFIVNVTAAYDSGFTDSLSKYKMFVYVNGESADDRVEVDGIDGGAVSFEFDLSSISDRLVEGTNNLTFHPNTATLKRIFDGELIFNNLTVNVKKDEEHVIGSMTYTTAPDRDSADYVIGESSIVVVNVEYNETYSKELGNLPIYININGKDTEIAIKANVTRFTVDLDSVSDLLILGRNTIFFHPNVGELEKIANVTFRFNNLTVNAENPPVDYNTTYVTVPTPSRVDYTPNESSKVVVSVFYDDYFNDSLSMYTMFVYINGEEMENRVAVEGVKGNATTFEFDIKTVSDRLVEGTNNLTFHPHPGALEGTFVGPYVFNPLTVNVGTSSEPIAPVENVSVIYVSPGGNDANSGGKDSPVATIAKAIELATAENNTEHRIIILEGTYNEYDLNVTSALDIRGEGKVVIDADLYGRILDINTTEEVRISGITFKNGKANDGGAISVRDAEITIDNCEFTGNDGMNGAAIIFDTDKAVLTNSRFYDNSCRNGVVKIGVYNWNARKSSGSNSVIENCSFENSHNLIYGNCMGVDIEEGTDNVSVIGCSFTNHRGEFGSEHGALYIKGNNAVVDNCLFENNTMGMAAAIQIDGENAVIRNSRFINNTVKDGIATRSGAIEVQNAATITGNIFIANGGESCSQGGAIDIVYATYGGDIVISGNTFINNTAMTGAAVYIDGGSEDDCRFYTLTIDDNIFETNTANEGAGIYAATSEGEITISNNEFRDDKVNLIGDIFIEGVEVIMESNSGVNGIYCLEGNIVNDRLIAIMNGNSTTYAERNEPVNITAVLVDDMGNVISGVSIKFKANGEVINETRIENGSASIEFSSDKLGKYVITGVSDLDNWVRPGVVQVIDKDKVIDIPDVYAGPGESVSVPVNVNVNGEKVNGIVNVTFNGKTFEAQVINGTANVKLVMPKETGEYDLKVSYNGIEKTKKVQVQDEFVHSVISITLVDGYGNVEGILKDIKGNPIADAVISYTLNGISVNLTTSRDGTFALKVNDTSRLELFFEGGNGILASNASITLRNITSRETAPVQRLATVILADDFEQYSCDYYAGERGGYFTAQLKDSNGNPLVNKTVLIGYNGINFNRTTNETGWIAVQIGLQNAGLYTFAMSYLGDDSYNASFLVRGVNIIKKPTSIVAKNAKFKAKTKTKKLTVTLTTIAGSSIDGKVYLKEGKKLTLKVNGKTYRAKTDADGKATFKITNLNKKGIYKAKITFAGDTFVYNKSKAKIKITVK